jgi:uncharacterized membrane protein
MENSQQTTNAVSTDNGKTVAIISYLSIIGWIIAYVMYGNNKTALGAFHLRQTIALYVVSLAIWVLQIILAFIPVIGLITAVIVILIYIALFVFWIIGFIAAINGQEKAIPIIGEKGQVWFKGIS